MENASHFSRRTNGVEIMGEFVKRCPECNSINMTVDEKRGEVVCKSCGLVLDENMVDTSP